MDKRLNEILTGKEDNCLLPFLWVHEGERDMYPGIIQVIRDSGARALCVESRPHENFCKDEWWDDMALILEEAKKRDMQVWILDDKKFPTGYANGLMAKYPERRKWLLTESHVDVVGPAPGCSVLLPIAEQPEEEVLLGVYAYRRTEREETISGEAIDLTGNVKGKYVYWDIPEGVYRIFMLYKTRSRGVRRQDYIDMLSYDSVNVQIEAVYEPHYAHFKEYFGNTLRGFFSDEPVFGNDAFDTDKMRNQGYDCTVGMPGLALPWSEEMLRRLSEKIGEDAMPRLVSLWYDHDGDFASFRVAYMDVITNMWKENFSYQLGNWCRDHGVEYIGHIIEDMNAHMRLSSSGGHYFRALDGQDMAGIDVVLNQIVPGLPWYIHPGEISGSPDSEFYDYVLARLAASHYHINPRMKNRAMCEIFGAFGWAEGVPFMTHLMDHMLVRGINRFVPHAFSNRYPDPDCPPHFNAGGHNPQYDAFSKLMNYTNKVTHLLAGGKEIVSCAIYYNAEAEWAGKGSMLMQKPARPLYNAQLNYDFLPMDTMLNDAKMRDGLLTVCDMEYHALVVPYSAYLPGELLAKLAELEQAGLTLLFIDGRPAGFEGGKVVSLDEVVDAVRAAGGTDVCLKEAFPLLRVAHYQREGADVFMLVNESMTDKFDGTVCLPVTGKGMQVKLLQDSCCQVDAVNGELRLQLDRGQSTLLVFGGELPADVMPDTKVQRTKPMQAAWTLSKKLALDGAEYTQPEAIDKLVNMTGPDGDPDFSGWLKYEAVFTAEEGAIGIDLGVVGETVHAWLNGKDLGLRVCAPYVYITDVQPGENRLTLEIGNSLVHFHQDRFSNYMQIPPSGLLGPVNVLY